MRRSGAMWEAREKEYFNELILLNTYSTQISIRESFPIREEMSGKACSTPVTGKIYVQQGTFSRKPTLNEQMPRYS